MAKNISFGSIELGVTTGPTDTSSPIRDRVFRVALIGDFTGRENRRSATPGGMLNKAPISIDRDNFDLVLEQLEVRLDLRLGNSDATVQTIRFRELDDFLPDRIYERAEVFAALRTLRRRLLNPDTFVDAARELTGGAETAAEEDNSRRDVGSTERDAAPAEPATGSLLDAAVAATEHPAPDSQVSSTGSPLVDHLIREIVAPHVIPAPDPRQAELVASVDAAIAEQMRVILHHPDFQALEAAWRGLYFLVRRLETGSRLKLFLFDVSKEELTADLKQQDNLAQSVMYKALVERSTATADGQPWSLLMGDFLFDASPEAADLLGRIAKICAQAHSPFVAGSLPAVVGCECFDESPDPDQWQLRSEPEHQEAWAELRCLPEAIYLGLAMPRVLLRLPYGVKTNPIESFDFTEMREPPQHGNYLWGNAAWMCAYALVQAYIEDGWQLDAGRVRQIDGLPLYVFREDGQSVMKPCAEAWLVDRAASEIAERGITPVVSVQNADQVTIPGVRSLSDPPAPLACGR